MTSDKELVSAEKRRFMLAIQPKYYSAKGPASQVIIVDAFSPGQAERIAVKKMKAGKNKFIKYWQITSVEDITK